MGLVQNYGAPTPRKWRKIGDAILLATSSLSAMMMGAPMSDHTIAMTIFILNVVGVVGKVLTNLAKEDETPTINNNTDKVQ